MAEGDHTVARMGEQATISRLIHTPRASSTLLGPGDDAAVIATTHQQVVVSTDILVEGQHFRRNWSTPYDIGRRAVAQNAADIEAMGAQPTGYVIAVAAPATTPVTDLEDLSRGATSEAQHTNADIVGGDVSTAPQLVVCVTALGQFSPTTPPSATRLAVKMNGAQPGDTIALAGNIGWSAAGLHILAGTYGETLTHSPLAQRARQLYRCPEPPYGCGVEAANHGATAMTDVSDGLLLDLHHIGEQSAHSGGVPLTLHLDSAAVAHCAGGDAFELAQLCVAAGDTTTTPRHTTISPTALAHISAEDILSTWIFTGGEDHGLLATFPPDATLPPAFTTIGRVVAATTITTEACTITLDGEPVTTIIGWDSFHHSTTPPPSS